MRRDYPQRQGSQDFGTTQSQLVARQERIQFIPPHPSMGQMNQFVWVEVNTDGPEGPECGSRSGTELTGQDFRDLGGCLCRCARG